MALWNILHLKDSFINLADEVRYDPLPTSPLVQWSRFYFKHEVKSKLHDEYKSCIKCISGHTKEYDKLLNASLIHK